MAKPNEEPLLMTQFKIRYPRGSFKKGKGSPSWRFPDLCACCGSASAGTHQRKIERQIGNTKYSLTFNVPYCPTCLGHVQARARESRIAATVGIVIGTIIALFVANWIRPIHSIGDIFEYGSLEALGFIAAGVVPGVIVYTAIVNFFTKREGDPLPRAANCTVPLHTVMAAAPDNNSLDAVFTCGSLAFANAFRDNNRQVIVEELPVTGTISRSPRGDAQFVRAAAR